MAGQENEPSSTSGCSIKNRKLVFGSIGLLVIIVIAVVVGVVATRPPKDLEIIASEAVESLPSLIKGAMIGNGAISVEFTELLEDKSTLFYYLGLNGDIDATTILNATGLDNPSLYLTPSDVPTIDDLAERESLYRIGMLKQVEFPVQLPESFVPGDFNGVLFIDEQDLDSTGTSNDDEAFGVSFKIVDVKRNIASPTEAPTPMPTMDGATRPPTAPTMAPVPSPTTPPLPEVLVSSLQGDSYGIEGTITIDYVMDLEGGEIVDKARLRFDVAAVSAPGPFLYLSKRSFSETKGGRLDDFDIGIDIEGVDNGSFTMDGRFEQILDEIEDVQELSEYEGGSFIIWCRPFGVYLGGGPIEASS